MGSKNTAKGEDSETLDITYLIDDDFRPQSSDADDTCKSFVNDIPTDGFAYKLYGDKIMSDVMKKCHCKNKCNDKLMKDPYILKHIQHLRSSYHMTRLGNERTAKTIDLLRSSLCGSADANIRKHKFMCHIICMEKWIDILAISRATYYRALIQVRSGFYSAEKRRKRPCSNIRGLDACGFIECFLDKYGDYSPERQKILLPSCINIKFIFDDYVEKPGPHLKEKHFYHIFKKHFEKIVSFSKTQNINPCDICLKANNELPKLHDSEAKQTLKQDLYIHLERQSIERKDYYKKRREACISPTTALSVIMDGMDQAKTNLPHFKGWVKPKSAGLVLKTHITGTIVHGQKKSFYIDVNQYPHDPNLTLTCLLNSICQGRNSFPPKIYIQCDNCGRENKNRYVLGFLAYLCLAGYVKEIYLSFLLKGHTHEDIDQQFSKVSQHIRTVNAFTIEQLQEAIKGSFINPPTVEVLGKIWDVKKWLSNINDISNHSYPHQFWLYCDRPGHVSLKTRMWSTDKWSPDEQERQLEILELDIDGNQVIPTGFPGHCTPDYEKINLMQIKSAIEKMKIHLAYDEYNWWKNFIDHPEVLNRNFIPWPLSTIQQLYKIEDIPVEIQLVAGQNENVSCLRPLLDHEEQVREVVTKQRRRRQQNAQN